MIIAQITDIHISSDLKPVHDVDVVHNFEQVLTNISKDDQVSHIALTGDLCFEEGAISTMEWVKERMDHCGKPYFVIPGNHDDSVIMAQVFNGEHHLHSDEFYFNVEVNGQHLIFLDTGKGRLSVDQISWLKAIDHIVNLPSLIFMHHPPVFAVPHMDINYALEDMEEIQTVLSDLNNVKGIFCGHYHVAKSIEQQSMPTVYISPSTFFQIDDSSETFKVDSYRIGWRKINWTDASLQTAVKWLETKD